jgi:hypothetical protein
MDKSGTGHWLRDCARWIWLSCWHRMVARGRRWLGRPFDKPLESASSSSYRPDSLKRVKRLVAGRGQTDVCVAQPVMYSAPGQKSVKESETEGLHKTFYGYDEHGNLASVNQDKETGEPALKLVHSTHLSRPCASNLAEVLRTARAHIGGGHFRALLSVSRLTRGRYRMQILLRRAGERSWSSDGSAWPSRHDVGWPNARMNGTWRGADVPTRRAAPVNGGYSNLGRRSGNADLQGLRVLVSLFPRP